MEMYAKPAHFKDTAAFAFDNATREKRTLLRSAPKESLVAFDPAHWFKAVDTMQNRSNTTQQTT
jgi:hypothetical protein